MKNSARGELVEPCVLRVSVVNTDLDLLTLKLRELRGEICFSFLLLFNDR